MTKKESLEVEKKDHVDVAKSSNPTLQSHQSPSPKQKMDLGKKKFREITNTKSESKKKGGKKKSLEKNNKTIEKIVTKNVEHNSAPAAAKVEGLFLLL